MKIVSWNVNSVRARFDHLLAFLDAEKPDVIGLQEIKCEVGDFPTMELLAAGYHTVALGQKSYNGVALLSREAPQQVRDGLDGDPGSSPQARAISARFGGVNVLNIYVPNGNEVSSDKFDYKLRWLQALRDTVDGRYYDDEPLIIMGDFNIAPRDIDVHDVRMWSGSVLCDDRVRQHLTELLDWGLSDAIPENDPPYSWWDYRGGGFERDLGLRIDLALHTSRIQVQSCRVAREWRGLERASDHAPLVVEIST